MGSMPWLPTPRRADARARVRRGSLLGWARMTVGCACAATAVVVAAVHVPRAVQAMNSGVRAEAYITSAQERVLTSGDSLGISFDLQREAMRLIPRRSTYALVLPSDPQLAASRYGIEPLTYGVLPAWFQYLLVPAEQVGDSTRARYVVCWGCDRAFWNPRLKWLWDNKQGQSIGRLR